MGLEVTAIRRRLSTAAGGGCQHRVVGEAQPGGGGEWPGWEEEEVAEEGGEDHGPWEGGRLDGAHHGEGAGEERKILGVK